MSTVNKFVEDTSDHSRTHKVANIINSGDKYLPLYLRNFSSDHVEEHITLNSRVHTVSQTDKSGVNTCCMFSIGDLMRAAADEIDSLRAEIKKYEKLKRIVDAVNAEMEE